MENRFDRSKKQCGRDVAIWYPDKYVVMVDIEDHRDVYGYKGYVHFVTYDSREADEECRRMGDSIGMKKVVVQAGASFAQSELGGLTRWEE